MEPIPLADRFDLAEANAVRCPDEASARRMQNRIDQVMNAGDTLGGVIEVIALGLPPGLGSYTQWDRRLDALLGAALLSVPAIKGVEVGRAFENSRLPGTRVHDGIHLENSQLIRHSNRSGGLEGGVTNGEPLVLRAAMKPVASTLTPQPSVDLSSGVEFQTRYERSDFCPVPRAVPVLEAMVAFVLAGALLEKLGGDYLDEMLPRFANLHRLQLTDLSIDGEPKIYWPPEAAEGHSMITERTTEEQLLFTGVSAAANMPRSFIFLYGPPGSGKSTITSRLARALGMPCLDLDSEIERISGSPIPKIFAQSGEASFRRIESETLGNVLSGPPSVIALGGGALLNPHSRRLAETSGTVVCLTAPLDVLVNRIQQVHKPRPLLDFAQNSPEDLRLQLNQLLVHRAEHYHSFPLQVDTTLGSPAYLSRQIQRHIGRFYLHSTGAQNRRGCPVFVQHGGLASLGTILKQANLSGPMAVVADTNVSALYGDAVMDVLHKSGYQASLIKFSAGEDNKTLDSVAGLYQGFSTLKLDRKSTVIALGGGITSDLAGFAASTYLRGINWVAVPTTLLAMADASIGGKTGYDLPQGKNLVGTFYLPRLVLADHETLASLPRRELVAGMAEVVKAGLIADPGLFDLCAQGWQAVSNNLEEVLCRSVAVKVRLVQSDPFERGRRAALNLGHTIGHAVDSPPGTFSCMVKRSP